MGIELEMGKSGLQANSKRCVTRRPGFIRGRLRGFPWGEAYLRFFHGQVQSFLSTSQCYQRLPSMRRTEGYFRGFPKLEAAVTSWLNRAGHTRFGSRVNQSLSLLWRCVITPKESNIYDKENGPI